MTAGLATLRTLQKEDGWRRLEALGAYLEQAIGAALLAESPVPVRSCAGSARCSGSRGSRTSRRARPRRSSRGAAAVYARVFHSLLDQGIALAPSAFEIAFLSLAHPSRDVDRLAEALRVALPSAATPAQ